MIDVNGGIVAVIGELRSLVSHKDDTINSLHEEKARLLQTIEAQRVDYAKLHVDYAKLHGAYNELVKVVEEYQKRENKPNKKKD